MFPQIFGKYILEREIAAGGMARVYLAVLRGVGGFEKRLVLKQIRPELSSDSAFLDRFVAEAKTAVSLNHPNIVPVFELGVEQGTYYLAMELCPGVSLAELLRVGPLSPEAGAYLGVELCRGLDYAHRKANIVHRDVTPRNVMIDEEGGVRLIDFGIASATGVDSERAVVGSPGHMAPEQVAGEDLSAASDVFALGVLLMECWTGQAPFRRSSSAESLAAMKQELQPLSVCVPELAVLDDVMASTVEPSAAERPQSAEELARPLREFLRDSDLGDVARRLGDSVAGLPHLTRDDLPTAAVGESQSVTPSTIRGTTETFAQNESMTEWTRRVPSASPEAAESDQSVDLPSSSPRVTRLSWAVLAVGVLTLLWWGVPSRPLLDPPMQVTASPQAAVPAATVASASASAAPSATSAPSPISAVVASASPPPTSLARSPAPQVSALPLKTASSQPSEWAQLSLTSRPPSQVSIGGRHYGTTPLSGIRLPPGSHTVIFENADLGERVPSDVRLSVGQQLRLHADFTGARPRVMKLR